MDIDDKNIIAFGNDYNNIEMPTNCCIGVATENTMPETKAAADYICGRHDSDGVAK